MGEPQLFHVYHKRLIHSFIQQTLSESLLCARYCTSGWREHSEQNDNGNPTESCSGPRGAYDLVGDIY